MNILNPAFKYLSAATHSDPQAFRKRMEQRKKQAAEKPIAIVTPIRKERKA